MLEFIMSALPFLIIVLALLVLILIGYVKAPPDQAYIISGLKKESKILIGRAGIRIPFFERLDKLYLGQMTVDIKTEQSVPTNDFINVHVDAVAKVRITPTSEGIKLAAKNFLNKRAADITMDLQDSLQGNMREIIGTLSLKEINTDRDSFSDQVMQKASRDMDKLGIEILSCNIQNVTDENGLIRDLGADNTAIIKKNAAIAKAQADRDVAIAQAEADKAANEARVMSDTQIAQKNTELEIKKAELKIASDSKKAEADAAYLIQEQEQQKSIETARVNAQIAKAERDAELKKQEVQIAKQKLDAEIRAQADAERYRMEQEAQADLFKRQKEAEARRYEEEQSAEAMKKAAEAAKFAKEQEAAGIAAVGRAEAEAIQAKALAEAEGIDRKAEAMKKYGEAAMVEMVMQALPAIAKNVAEPLSKVDKITMYGEGNSAKLLSDIINGTTQITEGFTAGMGIDVKALLSGIIGGKLADDEGHAGTPVINIHTAQASQPSVETVPPEYDT
ncbi:MAG: flotillin family protein [Oscillospiraceae bacterium]|nr:flotillin family protein [Oscillospiraceae bacterium]